MISYLKRFLEVVNEVFLIPDDFQENIYSWATNQIGHVVIPMLMCYLFGYWEIILISWVMLEINQLFYSKNWKDFFEDLFFEVGGIMIMVYEGGFPLYVVLVVFLIILIEKLHKKVIK